MINNISQEALSKLGIYELRNVARQVGVYSPTTYKKDELIKKVMAIVTGEDEPYVRKTNQGRPAKQIAGLDEILNIFVPEINYKTNFNEKQPNEKLFGLSMMQDITGLPENLNEFSGLVKIQKEGYAAVFKNGYFEDNKNTFYIAPKLLESLNLKECDFIKGLYYKNNEDTPQMVHSVSFINGKNTSVIINNERYDFESANAVYPNKAINLNVKNIQLVDFKMIDKTCPIGEGSRVCINYDKDVDIDDFVIDMCNSFSLSNLYPTSLLIVNERPEDISFIKDECTSVNVITNDYKINENDFVEFLFNKFTNIIRQVELNKNHIIVIKNLEKLKLFLANNYVIKNSCDIKVGIAWAEEIIKKLLLLSKNTIDEKSLTLVVFNCKDESMLDLFNNVINLKSEIITGSDLQFDIFTSSSIKPNLLLNENDYSKLKQLKKNLTKDNLKEELVKFL